ncbi:hypothetical protein LMG27174_01223 [Paraburkholderia rhynchosiae]|uniref:Uncharacterized protein n=1 Tax=Paraburkholderia rhynchosiae TaxID=487049 RepID=A0A6J5AMZ0_9BURK|nr:hypothetical protein LMG27174_01223 [Paraburkholderia rhynchosiae]
MAEQHRPGETVKTSSIVHGATHSHKHSELGSGDD